MHQYLFFIGDFPIRAYGAMLALAIICGASVAYVCRLYKQSVY